jgi:polysaccharide biosynthesis protein PslG
MTAFAPRMAARLTCFVALVALLALVLGSPGLAAPKGQKGAPRHSSLVPLVGVNIVGVDLDPFASADAAMERARAAHATVVRTEVPWSMLEPSGPGIEPRALAFMDHLVGDAAAAGIHVIMMVDGTPCWASSAPASLASSCHPGKSNAASSWPPSNASDYGAFVAYLAQRYGAKLAAIEIWNEPDQANELYFAGPEKVRRYAAIVRAAYSAIKQANRSVPVLAGSLVGANGVFLRALYAAGIKGYYDGLAVHYYTLTLGSVRAIHEVQLANGDHTPLWLDEFGWSACWPKENLQAEQACVTEQAQAVNITNIFRSLTRAHYVAAAVLWRLRDTPGENFGALNVSGAQKPAYGALTSVLASPFGSPQRAALRLRSAGGRIVASGSGPVGDYMQLEVFRGATKRYSALFTLDRFNRYSIKLPRVLGTHGLRVRVYQYWSGPGTAAHASI